MNNKKIVSKVTMLCLGIVAISLYIFNHQKGEKLDTIKPSIHIDVSMIKVSEAIMATSLYHEVSKSGEVDMAKIKEEVEILLDNSAQTASNGEEKIELEQTDTIPEEKRDVTSSPNRGNSIAENRTQPQSNLQGYLNSYVLDTIKEYKIGNYPYLLNNDYENYNGVSENLYYQGELLLKAHPSGNRATHCTGITFEVFFKSMQRRNKDLGIDPYNFNGMTKDELYDFVLTWYVANGSKSQSNLAVAVERYGIGNKITNMEDAAPGDFIDFSRENNTGHTAVFLNWIREGNEIIGFKYWSSQDTTNGVNYKEEYFNIKGSNGSKHGNVLIDNIYIARINPVNKYKKFK